MLAARTLSDMEQTPTTGDLARLERQLTRAIRVYHIARRLLVLRRMRVEAAVLACTGQPPRRRPETVN